MKQTLFTTYNNKYAENTEIVNLTDLRDNNLSKKNDFNEINDEI